MLSLGTEVSAKYRGAFCEAKIKKIVKVVKCRVSATTWQGFGNNGNNFFFAMRNIVIRFLYAP